MAYKYFIEDITTERWYIDFMRIEEPPGNNHWTTDPNDALQFDNAADAISFLNWGLTREGTLGQFTRIVSFHAEPPAIARQLVVTEHEFP